MVGIGKREEQQASSRATKPRLRVAWERLVALHVSQQNLGKTLCLLRKQSNVVQLLLISNIAIFCNFSGKRLTALE